MSSSSSSSSSSIATTPAPASSSSAAAAASSAGAPSSSHLHFPLLETSSSSSSSPSTPLLAAAAASAAAAHTHANNINVSPNDTYIYIQHLQQQIANLTSTNTSLSAQITSLSSQLQHVTKCYTEVESKYERHMKALQELIMNLSVSCYVKTYQCKKTMVKFEEMFFALLQPLIHHYRSNSLHTTQHNTFQDWMYAKKNQDLKTNNQQLYANAHHRKTQSQIVHNIMNNISDSKPSSPAHHNSSSSHHNKQSRFSPLKDSSTKINNILQSKIDENSKINGPNNGIELQQDVILDDLLHLSKYRRSVRLILTPLVSYAHHLSGTFSVIFPALLNVFACIPAIKKEMEVVQLRTMEMKEEMLENMDECKEWRKKYEVQNHLLAELQNENANLTQLNNALHTEIDHMFEDEEHKKQQKKMRHSIMARERERLQSRQLNRTAQINNNSNNSNSSDNNNNNNNRSSSPSPSPPSNRTQRELNYDSDDALPESINQRTQSQSQSQQQQQQQQPSSLSSSLSLHPSTSEKRVDKSHPSTSHIHSRPSTAARSTQRAHSPPRHASLLISTMDDYVDTGSSSTSHRKWDSSTTNNVAPVMYATRPMSPSRPAAIFTSNKKFDQLDIGNTNIHLGFVSEAYVKSQLGPLERKRGVAAQLKSYGSPSSSAAGISRPTTAARNRPHTAAANKRPTSAVQQRLLSSPLNNTLSNSGRRDKERDKDRDKERDRDRDRERSRFESGAGGNSAGAHSQYHADRDYHRYHEAHDDARIAHDIEEHKQVIAVLKSYDATSQKVQKTDEA